MVDLYGESNDHGIDDVTWPWKVKVVNHTWRYFQAAAENRTFHHSLLWPAVFLRMQTLRIGPNSVVYRCTTRFTFFLLLCALAVFGLDITIISSLNNNNMFGAIFSKTAGVEIPIETLTNAHGLWSYSI